jgi:serine/threonine protein kinase
MPVRKAVGIAAQIARGLAATHDKQTAHRDLKPQNLFLTPTGGVNIRLRSRAQHCRTERADAGWIADHGAGDCSWDRFDGAVRSAYKEANSNRSVSESTSTAPFLKWRETSCEGSLIGCCCWRA